MTMKPWLARALRRALLGLAVIIAAEGVLYRLLYAPPEFPPRDVDRLVVSYEDGSSRGIGDPETVRRVVAFVRSLDGRWTRLDSRVDLRVIPVIHFYRDDELVARAALGENAVILSAGDDSAVFPVEAEEAAELRRRLGSR